MKKAWFFSAIVSLSTVIGAQDYQLSFEVSGGNVTTIDSVFVHNINQGHSITIRGNDILHLLASTTGISELCTPGNHLEIYPNPISDKATVIFQNNNQGPIKLSLLNLEGKVIARKSLFQSAGTSIAEVGGLPAGVYILQIETETSNFSELILSSSTSGNNPEIIFKGTGEKVVASDAILKSSTSTSELVEMQYNTGDTLSLTAYAGNLYSESVIVPVSSGTISLNFYPVLEDISVSADISVEGGFLQVSDESGNIIRVTFPPGAIMDSTTVSLTVLGEHKELPIHEQQLRSIEIRPLDMNLYRPVEISIEYHEAMGDIENAALFRVRSEDWLTPLSDHEYSDDGKSMTASTLFPGDFAEGKMTLEQVNTQFDLLASSLDISWKSSRNSEGEGDQLLCDTRIHKAIWDDWQDVIGSFVSFFKLRYMLGYYNDLQEGQHTFEEEQGLLCTNVVELGVAEVLDLCIPEDFCDRDYMHTIASMVYNMNLLGCEGTTLDLLEDRFNQILIDCSSYLTIHSTLNIESGGLEIFTSGVVPITLQAGSNNTATVEGTGTLLVTGSGYAGGACTGVVIGETVVTVLGTRDAGYTYELQIVTEQNAVLTTTCPDIVTQTPLVGEDLIVITLSSANGYSYTLDSPVEGGTFVMDITLSNPYISLPEAD